MTGDVYAAGHDRVIHELSPEGSRPFCGADTIADSAHRDPARTVDCQACLRLLDDDVRRVAHGVRRRVDESED
jgi:hypothetical protein